MIFFVFEWKEDTLAVDIISEGFLVETCGSFLEIFTKLRDGRHLISKINDVMIHLKVF